MFAQVTRNDFRIGHQVGQHAGVFLGFAGNQSLPDGNIPRISSLAGIQTNGKTVEEFQFHTVCGLDLPDGVNAHGDQTISTPDMVARIVTPGGRKYGSLAVHGCVGDHVP